MLFSCCMIFCGTNLSCQAMRWLLLPCLLLPHEPFQPLSPSPCKIMDQTHKIRKSRNKFIFIVLFAFAQIFIMSIVPREVAWDDFGCAVCLRRVTLFNHCPCLLAKLWIEIGHAPIVFNCHTICCVVHCPRQIATSLFALPICCHMNLFNQCPCHIDMSPGYPLVPLIHPGPFIRPWI